MRDKKTKTDSFVKQGLKLNKSKEALGRFQAMEILRTKNMCRKRTYVQNKHNVPA